MPSINSRITSFFATVAFHGENQADWIQKLHILKKWRNIVDSYTVSFFLFLKYRNIDS